MKIVGHCLVKNEENYIYYALSSVIDFLDEILVWDMGSSDRTVEIIKSFGNPKIKFKQVSGDVRDVAGFRQQMIEETPDADWIFILDGDEIWYRNGISELVSTLKSEGDRISLVVSKNYMLIGDIYHRLDESYGKYRIGGRTGHLNVRAIKNIKGLHVEGEYPLEAYTNALGLKLQDFPEERMFFLKTPYVHASFLPRSGKDRKKVKYERGIEFPLDFYYPEAFFLKPNIEIKSPWKNASFVYNLITGVLSPLKAAVRSLR